MINKIKQKIFFYSYIKQVKEKLSIVYSVSESEKIIDILRTRFNIFIEENPSASQSEIKQYLASIGDFAQAGIQNTDIKDIENKITNTAYTKKKAFFILIIAIVIFIIFSSIFVADIILIKETTPVREEIIIE